MGDAILLASRRKIDKILVDLDVHGGLPELLEIDWRGRLIVQRLDYLRIPFRCSICHKMGHLRRNYMGRYEEAEVSEDRTLPHDLGNFEEEGNSFWTDCSYPLIESPFSLELDVTITGKLQYYCSVLFNSLSLLEKVELNAS
jgi:hypothetical protein